MKIIQNETFDQERALYGARDIQAIHCTFDGPADGESAFKEGTDLHVQDCFFNLRYPFWHDLDLVIRRCEMTEQCRAALWYSRHIEITDTKLHGIKALRECADVALRNCDIISPEFGWSTRGITMKRCTAQSEYFMMRSTDLRFTNVNLQGKYSFQYIENGLFDHCQFDTKDAFWHAKHVLVRDSVVRGEYLAWYCEDVTFENCTIIGTQPLCYFKNLHLINCKMIDTDLAFEKSEVVATITTPVDSIKNPRSGRISLPSVGTIIRDDPQAKGEIICTEKERSKKESCA